MSENFSSYIRKHRIESGFKSQRKLAIESGVSSATISRIESGIQKPEVETLKQLAPYLKSTTLVELMVVCGYWEEDDLLEPLENTNDNKLINNDKKTSSTEEAFLGTDIDFNNSEILNKYHFILDGKELTEEESKMFIEYIRFLRSQQR